MSVEQPEYYSDSTETDERERRRPRLSSQSNHLRPPADELDHGQMPREQQSYAYIPSTSSLARDRSDSQTIPQNARTTNQRYPLQPYFREHASSQFHPQVAPIYPNSTPQFYGAPWGQPEINQPWYSNGPPYHDGPQSYHRPSTVQQPAQLFNSSVQSVDEFVAVDPFHPGGKTSRINHPGRKTSRINNSLPVAQAPLNESRPDNQGFHYVVYPYTRRRTLLLALLIDVLSAIFAFVFDKLPRQVYLHLLLRLPSFYFSRVARIFEEAEMTMPEIEQMVVQAPMASLPVQQLGYSLTTPASANLKSTWEGFIDSLLREWKILNIVSVLLLSAILTMFQIESAAADPITRNCALVSLICALMSLLYGCMYIIRFASMRKTYKALEWAQEAQKTKTLIWWNVWVLLAMPATWLAWSIILFIACIMAFVWRTNTLGLTSELTLSDNAQLGVRIAISAVLGLGVLYFALIINTLRRYGDSMDKRFKADLIMRVQLKAEERRLQSMGLYPAGPLNGFPVHAYGHAGHPLGAELAGSNELFPTTKIMDLQFRQEGGTAMPQYLLKRGFQSVDWEKFITEVSLAWEGDLPLHQSRLLTRTFEPPMRPQDRVAKTIAQWNRKYFNGLMSIAVLCHEYLDIFPDSPSFAVYLIDGTFLSLDPISQMPTPFATADRFGLVPEGITRIDIFDQPGRERSQRRILGRTSIFSQQAPPPSNNNGRVQFRAGGYYPVFLPASSRTDSTPPRSLPPSRSRSPSPVPQPRPLNHQSSDQRLHDVEPRTKLRRPEDAWRFSPGEGLTDMNHNQAPSLQSISQSSLPPSPRPLDVQPYHDTAPQTKGRRPVPMSRTSASALSSVNSADVQHARSRSPPESSQFSRRPATLSRRQTSRHGDNEHRARTKGSSNAPSNSGIGPSSSARVLRGRRKDSDSDSDSDIVLPRRRLSRSLSPVEHLSSATLEKRPRRAQPGHDGSGVYPDSTLHGRGRFSALERTSRSRSSSTSPVRSSSTMHGGTTHRKILDADNSHTRFKDNSDARLSGTADWGPMRTTPRDKLSTIEEASIGSPGTQANVTPVLAAPLSGSLPNRNSASASSLRSRASVEVLSADVSTTLGINGSSDVVGPWTRDRSSLPAMLKQPDSNDSGQHTT